ncbi:zinc finger protein 62 homolog [Maniola jurtina]|uniref:zinc finger protein 62 homolog n=1 Tax=Maniola jurtina TaxID=191418 RepID=UPI001E68FBCC|nr:zinc finger protein 62 homolog [Maniola jurtina]
MEDDAKLTLKKICCACLSVDRKLSQLCKLKDGVNNLFTLVSVDSEAYEAMFRRDGTQLYICWECGALMRRQRRFIDQVCDAQKQLSQIIDGQVILKPQNSLSKLTRIHQNTYDKEFIFHDIAIDNFIDCGPDIHIPVKSETPLIDIDYELASVSDGESTIDNVEEITVSENKLLIKPLTSNKRLSKGESIDNIDDIIEVLENEIKVNIINEKVESQPKLNNITVVDRKFEIKPLENNRKLRSKSTFKDPKDKKIKIETLWNKRKVKKEEDFLKEDGFSRMRMTEEELLASIERRKSENDYVLASYKCESCVEVFKDQNDLEEHNSKSHLQKSKFIQCDICQVYIKFWWLAQHKDEHYVKYQCNECTEVCYNVIDMLLHLKNTHDMRNVLTKDIIRRLKRRAQQTKPDLAPKKSDVTEEQTNEDSPSGYKCAECNKCFENRYQRYKHVMRQHREGHKCDTCGKTFAFKNTLTKHVQIHAAPQPMEQCAVCGKMVRRDGVRAHARIHGTRATFHCVACDKRFVSRDSYEKHLKYSSKHAVTDVRKYKCTMCDKGFRTATALNDHVNYNHMGKTQHKCPICHKALATRRCVTRHVSRAHLGIKEKSGDKILCQTCGKAFRDTKCLREHELIHTGEKPLSCDLCGRTFRQSACLYTHKRRVHKVTPARLRVRHTTPDCATSANSVTLNVNKSEIS